jgi:hypothetical protein
MNINISKLALALALSVAAASVQAVVLDPGSILLITSGVQDGDNVTSGSWYGLVGIDGNASFNVYQALSEGTHGLLIGYSPLNNSTAITAAGTFFGIASSNYLTSQVTGGTSGLDMSGWVWDWAGDTMPMANGAWGAGYTDGIANFSWDGIGGHTYTLDYHATAPFGAANGVQYALHLEGSVIGPLPVPEANTWAMMLAGLGLLGVTVRYRKR